MDLFPNLEIGVFNGWILIVLFFGAYGIMLAFFPKDVIVRLSNRSGQRKHQPLRRLFVGILVLLWLFLASLTPLKIGRVDFLIGFSIFPVGWPEMYSLLITSKTRQLIRGLQVGFNGASLGGFVGTLGKGKPMLAGIAPTQDHKKNAHGFS